MDDQSRDLSAQDLKILAGLLLGAMLTAGWFASYRTSHLVCGRSKQSTAAIAKASIDIDFLAKALGEHARTHGVRCSLQQLVALGVLEECPTDPWGHEYIVSWQADTNTAMVLSHGPDGIANTADDLASTR